MSEAAPGLTIVVGYDGSEAARRGLARVKYLGTAATRVVVVAANPDLRSPALGQSLVEPTVDARQLLDEARSLLAPREQLVIETCEAAGDPAEVLVDTARTVNADLVIVGRRGSDFVARMLLGSVAERVVRQAPCDVLVVA